MHSRIAMILFAGTFLLAQAETAVPKTGGVCFRFDDNKPPEHWRQMGELFEKYGYRMSLALVSQDLNRKISLDGAGNIWNSDMSGKPTQTARIFPISGSSMRKQRRQPGISGKFPGRHRQMSQNSTVKMRRLTVCRKQI